MQRQRYAWQVEAIPLGSSDMRLLEISADELEVSEGGNLVFWAHTDGVRRLVLVVFKAGDWNSAVIQSAMDGLQNGYKYLEN